METIGQRVHRLRTARGLSQRELAEPGVSYAYISRIEAGTRRPSVKALRRIAGKLGCSADYLETGQERITAAVPVGEIDQGIKRWGGKLRWDDLTDDERTKVTQGLDDALRDALVARIYAVDLDRNRQLEETPA